MLQNFMTPVAGTFLSGSTLKIFLTNQEHAAVILEPFAFCVLQSDINCGSIFNFMTFDWDFQSQRYSIDIFLDQSTYLLMLVFEPSVNVFAHSSLP